MNHIYQLNQIINIENDIRLGIDIKADDLETTVRSLTQHRDTIQRCINGDLFERIQDYGNDIKKLKKQLA